jgi:hypothetical protein
LTKQSEGLYLIEEKMSKLPKKEQPRPRLYVPLPEPKRVKEKESDKKSDRGVEDIDYSFSFVL